jgi:hypothetical protein
MANKMRILAEQFTELIDVRRFDLPAAKANTPSKGCFSTQYRKSRMTSIEYMFVAKSTMMNTTKAANTRPTTSLV